MMRPDAGDNDIIIHNEQLDPEIEPDYQKLSKIPIEKRIKYKPQMESCNEP